jgi:cytosine/adenosine deaminase-related metal-dependent hydrolase
MLITAPRIHDGKKWLPEGTVIEVAENGSIIQFYEEGAQPAAIKYEGFLCPGFVNTHCHLELSHMKGAVPEHTGLIPFLQAIPRHRDNYTEEQKKTARMQALYSMAENGIVAVGDIANVTETLDVRAQDVMHFYTFAEALGFADVNAKFSFARSLAVYNAFAAQQPGTKILKQDVAPHAPYSVSATLFGIIGAHSNGVLSVHNQESEAEDEYYQYKTGAVTNLLHGLGIDDSTYVPPGTTSLSAYLHWLPHNRPYLLIHNTYTTAADVLLAQSLLPNLYWCLCPGANLYIENRLPDVAMFLNHNAAICIGTDSLASNHTLSIWEELKLLKLHYPALEWETLLRWGTYNGACALQMDDVIGSIALGKRPGIINIDQYSSSKVKIVA